MTDAEAPRWRRGRLLVATPRLADSHFHRAVRILERPDRAAPWRALRLDRYGLAGANDALDRVARLATR